MIALLKFLACLLLAIVSAAVLIDRYRTWAADDSIIRERVTFNGQIGTQSVFHVKSGNGVIALGSAHSAWAMSPEQLNDSEEFQAKIARSPMWTRSRGVEKGESSRFIEGGFDRRAYESQVDVAVDVQIPHLCLLAITAFAPAVYGLRRMMRIAVKIHIGEKTAVLPSPGARPVDRRSWLGAWIQHLVRWLARASLAACVIFTCFWIRSPWIADRFDFHNGREQTVEIRREQFHIRSDHAGWKLWYSNRALTSEDAVSDSRGSCLVNDPGCRETVPDPRWLNPAYAERFAFTRTDSTANDIVIHDVTGLLPHWLPILATGLLPFLLGLQTLRRRLHARGESLRTQCGSAPPQ